MPHSVKGHTSSTRTCDHISLTNSFLVHDDRPLKLHYGVFDADVHKARKKTKHLTIFLSMAPKVHFIL